MPTYQYECAACEHAFETMQSMMDKKLKKCPKCGKLKLHRLIGAGSGIIFKGTGFYETDYKRKDAPSSQREPTGPKELTGKPKANSAKSTSASSPKEPAGKASGSGSSSCCGGGACGR